MTYGSSDGFYWDRTNSLVKLFISGTEVWRAGATRTGGNIILDDGTIFATTALSGDLTVSSAGVTAIGSAKVTPAMLAKPRLRCVEETITAASLTDGGGAVGTKNLTAAVPAGARYLFTTVDTIVGFAGGGQASCVVTFGDGSDVDRYNTGTPDVFTTLAAGVDMGAPSGTAFHATAISAIVATFTANADITGIIAGSGSVKAKFWFLEPI